MSGDHGYLFGFADVFNAINVLVKKVRTANSGFIIVNGSENGGKTALLDAVEKDFQHEECLRILKVDLLDLNLPPSLAMIAIFQDYLTDIFSKDKGNIKSLIPFKEILWKAMPVFCRDIWQIETISEINDQDSTFDEVSCFSMLCNLVLGDSDEGNSIILLVDNADSDNWRFLSVLSNSSTRKMGIVATATNVDIDVKEIMSNRELSLPLTIVDLPALTDIDVIKLFEYKTKNISDLTNLARTIVKLTKGNPTLVLDVISLIDSSTKIRELITKGHSVDREIQHFLEKKRTTYILEHYDKDLLNQTKYLVLFSGTFNTNHVSVALGISFG